MAPSLVRPADGEKFVQDRLNTREWWLIPVTDVKGMAFVEEVTRRFYRGDNKVLMDALTIPNPTADVPCLCLVLAAKSCMSPTQLQKLIVKPVPKDGSRNILVPSTTALSIIFWLHSRFQLPSAK